MSGFRHCGFPKTLSNAVLGDSWDEATKATGPERGQWKWRQRERIPCNVLGGGRGRTVSAVIGPRQARWKDAQDQNFSSSKKQVQTGKGQEEGLQRAEGIGKPSGLTITATLLQVRALGNYTSSSSTSTTSSAPVQPHRCPCNPVSPTGPRTPPGGRDASFRWGCGPRATGPAARPGACLLPRRLTLLTWRPSPAAFSPPQ